ncbi:MAG: hypothetical protein DCF25_16865 [Leptolyngbya foveolarum]|uniref:Uncharacterized protein n=1 Tax=Leptolyngbya foveolarum TaxID=47253 RepID=A0A2W4TVJ9_9CYAN|nr:MAG: hypothetical protein DCF25_16865 [Leptolyngbya foveolarum]
MSTQRPDDISEAVVVPSAAAATVGNVDDALSPDDKLLQTNSEDSGESVSPEELDKAAKDAESEVIEKVRGDADAPAPIHLESNSSN